MKFLPPEDFFIISPLKPQEVSLRLANEVEPVPASRYEAIFAESSLGRYFCGFVTEDKFEIERIIDYRNTNLPQIKGTIDAFAEGSRIYVKITKSRYTSRFTGIWLCVNGLLAVGICILDIATKQLNWGPLIPTGFFLFVFLLVPRAFKAESELAKNKLCEVFEGTIE
jgi:hypothetical protein